MTILLAALFTLTDFALEALRMFVSYHQTLRRAEASLHQETVQMSAHNATARGIDEFLESILEEEA